MGLLSAPAPEAAPIGVTAWAQDEEARSRLVRESVPAPAQIPGPLPGSGMAGGSADGSGEASDTDVVDVMRPASAIAMGLAGPQTVGPISGEPRTPLVQTATTPRAATAGLAVHSDPRRHIVVAFDLEVGEPARGRTVWTDAVLLEPSSPVTGTVHSRARTLFSDRAEWDGTFSAAAALPSLEPGAHSVIVRATTDAGRSVTVAGGFELDEEGVVVSIAAPRPLVQAQPDDPRILRALGAGLPAHDARADLYATAVVGVVAAVVAGMVGTGAAVRGTGGAHARRRAARARAREAAAGGQALDASTVLTVPEEGLGDRSGTWRWPHTDRADALTWRLSTLGASRSTVLPRLAGDGAWARAMFGGLGYGTWLVAAIAALAAAQSDLLAPAAPSLLALVALGILDASAGAVGWIVLTTASLLTGSVHGVEDVRTIIGLGLLIMAMPLVANLVRPLSRPHPLATPAARLERAIDYLVAPVVAALVAGGAAMALNGFSGLELLSPAHLAALLWTVAVAVVVRYGLEDLSAALYPSRRRDLTASARGRPSRGWTVVSAALAFGLAVFAAQPFVGLSAVVVVVSALSVMPALLFLVQDYLPDSPVLHRWLPRGLPRVLIVVLASAAIATVFIGDGAPEAVPPAMVLMVLPGITLAVASAFGRSGPSRPDTALTRLGGVLTWVVLVSVIAGAAWLLV